MDKARFTAKLRKAIQLSGHYLIDEETRDELYEVFKFELDNDILYALKLIAYASEKINYSNIHKHISDRKTDRLIEEKVKRGESNQLTERDFDKYDMPPEAKDAIGKLREKFKGGLK